MNMFQSIAQATRTFAIHSLGFGDRTLHIEEEVTPDTVYVKTVNDLPTEGNHGVKYHVLEETTDWKWIGNGYQEINPYVFGVDQVYCDSPRVVKRNQMLVDPTADFASISLDQVREGGSPMMSALYNLIALRADLDTIRRFNRDKTIGLMTLVSKGPSANPLHNATNWFAREHKALYALLRSSAHSKNRMYLPMCDALHKQGASLTWDDRMNQAIFKVDEFQVYL